MNSTAVRADPFPYAEVPNFWIPVAAAMAVELCPVTAFAVTGDQVAADGTYTSTAQVNRDPAADVDDDWADYGVSVELTVKDGKFENRVDVNRVKEFMQVVHEFREQIQ